MGRKLEFEPGEAVQKAMMVFWRKGYERTSVGDLEEETGVGRKSLYRAFHDKEDLFLASLAAYRRFMNEDNLAHLIREDADLETIRALLDRLAGLGGTAEGSMGCLICNTAVEVGRDHPEVSRHVEGYFDQIRRGMTLALRNAASRGQVRLTEGEIAQEANFLFGVVQSLCVFGRAGVEAKAMRDVVASAMRRLA
jgi:TetR/AcrR family transcriptional regulator, transcriptional repressor for nem operon